MHYGTGDVYGYNCFDSVCVSEGICAHHFSFLLVGEQNGLERLAASGIVGMSPFHNDPMSG